MKKFIFLALILFTTLGFSAGVDILTLTWGGGETDTTYSLSYSANDTSIAFRVYPFTDNTIQIRTVTFDADSACRISFYPVWSPTGEAGTYTDSACGTRIQLRDSITASANAWTPPLSLSLTCPMMFCRIVADGSAATGHMNGGTTVSTGVARVTRYQP